MSEHLGTQPVHDLLADLGADPGLDDTEGSGHGGDGDHAEHEPDEQAQVLVGQRNVDHGAQQERRRHGHDRGDDDDRRDDRQLPAVGGEQASDATQRHLTGLGFLGGADFRRAAATHSWAIHVCLVSVG